jgi:8-oxo-dGTP pyrophosphatase MutT (NUDIX family)
VVGDAGGGLEGDETFIGAAARELREETGLNLEIGPWVWTRRHAYQWGGRWCDQYERFFVARTSSDHICPELEDSYVIDKRWWSLDQLLASKEIFAPRRLAQ